MFPEPSTIILPFYFQFSIFSLPAIYNIISTKTGEKYEQRNISKI